MELDFLRKLAPALLLAAGCAPLPPPSGPAGRPEPAPFAAPNPCAHRGEGFVCVLPAGYLITDEDEGPGRILTLMRRSRTRAEEATITVRVYPLAGKTLEWLVRERVMRPFSRAAGVEGVSLAPVRVRNADGFEVSFVRRYANGDYAQRFLAFEDSGKAFVVQMTVPLAGAEKERRALDAFVDSVTFHNP